MSDTPQDSGETQDRTPSAIVIGAGITGVAAAIRLRRMGWRVTIIDRAPPGDRAAASYGNAGLLARCSVVPVSTPGLLGKAPAMLLDPDQPLYLRWSYLPRLFPFLVRHLLAGRQDKVRRIATALAGLTGDSVDEHKALASGSPAARYIQTGPYGFLYKDRKAYEKDQWGHDLRAHHGFVPEIVEGPALRELDPALSPDQTFGALFPDHGWLLNPGAYVAALAETFMREGGQIRRGEVASVSAQGAVTLKGGATMRADKVVLAAGAWSARLAAGLGLHLPMETERGYHLFLRGASQRPPNPWMVVASKAVATPMEDGVRFAGIVEFGGLDAGPSKAPQELLRKTVQRVYPDIDYDEAVDWMGHRPTLADSLPALGEIPGAPAVVCAFGGQHVGLTMGPRLGRMAAQIAAGRPGNEDISAIAPDRFRR